MTRPILLIAASPPGGIGVGQLFMRSLLLHAPAQFVIAALLGRQEPTYQVPSDLGIAATVTLQRRFEPAFRPWSNRLSHLAAAMAVRARLEPQVRRLLDPLTQFAQRHGATALFVVLECPTTMLLAAPLADRLGLPLVTLVWDTPEHILGQLGHLGPSRAHIKRGFDRALVRSHGVAVMSEAMRDRYASEYGARCVILHQPIEPDWLPPHIQDERAGGDLVIGFAGSDTARPEMLMLLSTLDRMQWQLQGRQVILRVFGLRFVCEGRVPRRIDYRGYLPEIAAVVKGLSDCDLLFLPQPFAPEAASFTRYSFPTKLTTYLAARRPILLFAPDHSALTTFFRDNEVPLICSQTTESALIESLEALATDTALQRTAQEQIEAGTRSAFSVELFQRQLLELFKTDTQD